MANITHRMRSNLMALYAIGKGMKRADDPDCLYIHSTQCLETYLRAVNSFGKWLKEQGVSTHCSEETAAEYIQRYIDYLTKCGKSESTIHTYLAGICKALDKSMGDYEKPRRVSAARKGRAPAASLTNRCDADETNPKYERLIAFARCVGIRRAEYADLRAEDFEIIDGNAYVIVRRGKGGKLQRQLIAPENAEFVASYFEGLSNDERVFSPEEMNNKLDLHKFRREYAQQLYVSLVEQMKHDPTVREKLIRDLKKAFERSGEDWRSNPDMQRLDTPYHTRGHVRRHLEERGLPTSYDRVALMTVSVNNLAHWRASVMVKHYMM